MTTTYRQADGGYDVLKDGIAVGTVPFGNPRAQEIEDAVAKGRLVVAPALPAVEPEPPAPVPTLEHLIAVLIKKKVITQGDLDAE